MTLFGISVAFAMLLVVLGTAMIVHSIVGKRRIVADFRRLSERIGGTITQRTPMAFPRITGRYDGRDASVFFHLAKGEKASIIYMVCTLSVKAASGFFLAKDKYFKTVNDPIKLTREVGDLIPGLDGRYQIRGTDAERAQRLFQQGELRTQLDVLEAFPSLVLGPDSLVAGKPFESAEETSADSLLTHFRALGKIATEMEAVA